MMAVSINRLFDQVEFSVYNAKDLKEVLTSEALAKALSKQIRKVYIVSHNETRDITLCIDEECETLLNRILSIMASTLELQSETIVYHKDAPKSVSQNRLYLN